MPSIIEKWQTKKAEAEKSEDAEVLAGLYNSFNEEVAQTLDTLVKSKEANENEVKELQSELLKIKDEQLHQLNHALKKQGLAIEKISRSEKETRNKSVREQLKEGLREKAADIANLRERETAQPFSIKVVGDMTFSGNVSGGNIPVEDRIEGLNIIPSRQVRLLNLMTSRTTQSNVVSWVYQTGKEGAAGQTDEGAAKNQIDFDLVVANESIVKTTAYIKISDEMLDDIDWIESEVNSELLRELLKSVEATTYGGNGTPPNHNGIRTVASAFAAGAFASAVDNANRVDVLAVALNQIMIAQETSDFGNMAILMHPTDVTFLKVAKVSGTDRRYVDRLQMIGGSLLFDMNIPIIPTTLVTVDEYLIGDFSKAISVQRDGVDIQMGYDGNDFTTNFRTIRAEWRGATIVKNNDRTAFVAGDFSTDTAALETV